MLISLIQRILYAYSFRYKDNICYDKSFHAIKNQYPFSFSSRLIVPSMTQCCRSLYCVIMLFLDYMYGYGCYIMWFCFVNPYNDKGGIY